MGPRRPAGPVSQHERVAIEDQVHQGASVGRGNRPQIGGKPGHIGEHVHRPEPAGEFSSRDHTLGIPGALVDQDPAPGPPVPPGRQYPLTVRAPSLYVHISRIWSCVNGPGQGSG